MPGEYDVVATPPASMRCALFAERRPIKAPEERRRQRRQRALYVAEGRVPKRHAADDGPGAAQRRERRSDRARPQRRDRLAARRPERHALQPLEPDHDQPTNGSFKLPVDLGSYDIVIKPPVDSGFPWQVSHDVKIGVGARKAPLEQDRSTCRRRSW